LKLSYDGKTITVLDVAQIYKSLTSSKSYSFAASDFSGPPAAPTGLAVSSMGALTWTDNSDTETAYFVERRTGSNGAWATLAGPLAANTTTYTDGAVAYSSDFYYRVYAKNDNGASGYSSVVQFVANRAASVTLSASSLSLTLGGDSAALTASVAGAEASAEVTDAKVSWSSDDAGVATVTSAGLVAPVSAGTARITATTEDGSHTATCDVTVYTPVAVSTRLIGSLIVSGAYTSFPFTNQSGAWIQVVIPSASTYCLSWIDAGDGDGSSTLDVLVSLYQSDCATVVSGADSVDSGYTTPARVALDAGIYYIKAVTKDGAAATGSLPMRIYSTLGGVIASTVSRLSPGAGYATLSFSNESSKLLAFDITAAGAYLVQWSDSADGDGAADVDVTVSLYDSTKTNVYGGLGSVDAGYTNPHGVSFSAGRYYLVVASSSGDAVSGSCRLRVFSADTTSAAISFIDRLCVGASYSRVDFDDRSSFLVAVDVPSSGYYYLQWSDSGQGDGTDSADALVSLYDSSKSAVLDTGNTTISSVDSGYSDPPKAYLYAGRYYIGVASKSGSAISGSMKCRVYSESTGATLGLNFMGRLSVGPAYTTVSFSRESSKWLAVAVPSAGTYCLRMSDASAGDGSDTVDALATLFYSDKSTAVSACVAVDSSYAPPLSLGTLSAGTYYLRLATADSALATGTIKVMIYGAE
jgi:hypothetical protein